MFNISDYLKKFTKIEGDSRLQNEAIQRALKEICGIDNASFELKKGILYMKTSPVAKTLIYTRKARLLEAIKAAYPGVKIIDIR